MQDETSRTIFKWYMRFDLFVGLQAGSETVLTREWSQACLEFFMNQVRENPDNLGWKYEERFARSKALATDIAMFFARRHRGVLDEGTFEMEAAALGEELRAYHNTMDPSLVNPENLVTDFSNWPERDPYDIVNPYDPTTLYAGENYTTNFMYNDILGIEMLFKYQLAVARQQAPGEDLLMMSYRVAQLCEAIAMYPGARNGAVLETQASLGMACLFLPKDERHIQWCRRKFALVESLGYTAPFENPKFSYVN